MNHAWRRRIDTLWLLLFVLLWIQLFTIGVHVNTNPIRERWSATGSISLSGFAVVFFCWTWSNLMLLCCTAAVIGGLGRSFIVPTASAANIRGATIKGFLVYLLSLTGQLVVLGTLPTAGSAGSNPLYLLDAAYFRFAGFVSLLSFLVGYSPRLFSQMLERIEHLSDEAVVEERPKRGVQSEVSDMDERHVASP